MTETTDAELASLIAQLDQAGQQRFRSALVCQALSYAELLLQDGEHPDERTCLAVVAQWLEQPDDPERQRAVDAELQREDMLVMGEQDPIPFVWDVARAARLDLQRAGAYTRRIGAHVGGWLNPEASRVDRIRGRRVAASRAEESAAQWQIAAARAILAGSDPPPLPALPPLLDNPAEIVAYVQHAVDPHRAYARGDLRELRLLLTREQDRQLAALELVQVLGCAELLLPPSAEDRGERACLGHGKQDTAHQQPAEYLFRRIAAARSAREPQQRLLKDVHTALIGAQVRSRQYRLAEALAGGLPLTPEPQESTPLSGRAADYRAGNLGRLCATLDATGLLKLKQALVGQAIWYAMQVLPGPAADRGHLDALRAAEEWLRQPHTDPPADRLGQVPAGESLASALVWNATCGVTLAARAAAAQELLQALHTVVVTVAATHANTTATSAEAEAAAFLARDYQLAAAMRIGDGQDPPLWIGPDERHPYSIGSIDAAIRRMGADQQGRLRWALIRESCGVVLRGLGARAAPTARTIHGRQLVEALLGWAAHPEAGIQGAILIPDAALQAAGDAGFSDQEPMAEALSMAFSIAARPRPSSAQTWHATRVVAEYCEKAARFAASAIAERWTLDATYALLRGAKPPQLPTLASG